MKVLLISHSCVVDVNQQVFVELESIPDVEVCLLLPSHWKSDITGEIIRPKFLPEATFPVLASPVYAPGHISFHCYKRLPVNEIKAFGPDVILSTQEPWSLSNLQGIYLSSALQVPFLFQTNQNIYKKYPPPFSWLEQLSYRRCAIALAYSEEARQVMIKKGLAHPSEVVPYATDTRRFVPMDSASLRARMNLTGAVVIGFMGRLVPEKGLDTLLEAFARIKSDSRTKDIPTKLLFVGAGPQETELKRILGEAHLLDDAVFTGAVPHTEAAKYMNCMDIFVLPSRTMPNWKEQFGRVIIEAMSCHVPVVGSDSGQIPHLIRETGGGLVFPEGDVAALADALASLVLSPQERKRLATQGATVVEERFTCQAVAGQIHRLLLTAVGKTGADSSVPANPVKSGR